MKVKCFFITETEFAVESYRRFASPRNETPCVAGRYHNAQTVRNPRAPESSSFTVSRGDTVLWNNPNWPVRCEACDYQFTDNDSKQIFQDRIYVDENGKEYGIRNPPIGAMWYADWYNDITGPDGHCLIVSVPENADGTSNHPWMVDGSCSNCTRPNEPHDCWCRHGTVPNITVDKTPEPGRSTCSAGGGSIQTAGWHGFLKNGWLSENGFAG